MAEIEKNMLRERAKKISEVTEEDWQQVNKDYRKLVEEFLDVQNLSPQSYKQYRSGLRLFGKYVYESMNNKYLYKMTKRDMLRYLSYLKNRGLSSSGINLKKACISSLMNYIENIVADEDENYKMFRNITRGLPAIPKNQVYQKIAVSKDEYDLIMKTLEDDENYLGMAWVATAMNVGARRSEIIQFKTEILDYDFPEESTFVLSHIVRGKGKSDDGKPLQYMMNREALKYMKLWVDNRGYNHEHIFTTKYNGEARQMSTTWADNFCANTLSDILGRRINPHIWKASCVTNLLETGVKLELVSKYVAHHENVATTIAHYDLRDFEEEKNQIFK